jgi:hypothetical protein
VHVRMNMTTGRQEVFEPYPPGYDPELEAML